MTIESIRRICLSMPGVSEDIKWEDSLVFSVGGKMFVMVNMEPPHGLWFKCSPEEFAVLIERDGIIPAPYLARAHWVAIETLDDPVDRRELEDLLRRAYDLVLARLPKVRRDQVAASARTARSRRVSSADGVEIAYVVRGDHPVSLVFIHGGLADRHFWKHQVSGLSEAFTVVALDLAGHGQSGRGRGEWTIPAFGEDVRAVVEAMRLTHVVLIGNSLGGPVALEAAALLPGTCVGVVGVDTLHEATQKFPVHVAHERAEGFRQDFARACRAMVDSLFHPGTQARLRAWAERRMLSMSQDVVVGMMEGMGGYDMAPAFRNAGVPLRAINGDLWAVNIAGNLQVVRDFDAVVMNGAGHYPMLERPEEFNRLLVEMVTGLTGDPGTRSGLRTGRIARRG
jgi:pimeloyl-ACP methyl ester carboxylesterase/predicted DNA-binding protein (MmcQ/YjbR family)